ncbi:MAG TPA: hypothetical protein PLQ11_05305 [Beijerinckiaceae bacterium]|nr:hypothetical protein [Beijerinckiaceae bacterium]
MAAEPKDMIVPMLKEMRAENAALHGDTRKRLDKIEQAKKGFRNALAADSLMSKMMIGDWEERIEALEKKVRKLESSK